MDIIFQKIIAFITLLTQLVTPLSSLGGEASSFEDWSSSQVYTEDYAITIEKAADEDFVILNLTDVQLKDGELYIGMGRRADAMIQQLIEETQPDIITLTGDNAWGSLAYAKLCDYIDSFGIPWAPVMGNHDGQNTLSEYYCTRYFVDSENCLWKYGPKDMGYGNYIINIEENGEVIHSMFMMDTHSDGTWTNENGEEVSGYDHLWDNQIEWYKWAVKGIEKTAGKKVESSVFMHIPVYEVRTVWEEYYDSENDCFTGPYAEGSFGVIHETPCPGAINNHFMDAVLELGSTKNIVFGHDHVNNSSFLYQGVRLTYGLKLGEGCYFEEGLEGGTTLTIDSTGNVITEHIFC